MYLGSHHGSLSLVSNILVLLPVVGGNTTSHCASLSWFLLIVIIVIIGLTVTAGTWATLKLCFSFVDGIWIWSWLCWISSHIDLLRLVSHGAHIHLIWSHTSSLYLSRPIIWYLMLHRLSHLWLHSRINPTTWLPHAHLLLHLLLLHLLFLPSILIIHLTFQFPLIVDDTLLHKVLQLSDLDRW